MNELVNMVLRHRGMTAQKLDDIEDPTHGELNGIDELCDKLHDIHESGDNIVVLPDFDMDGIMSGTIGHAGLRELGFDADLFIPDSSSYGFDEKEIDRLHDEFPSAKAIITCDTGIGCEAGARRADELGIDVIITDHHIEDKGDSVRPFASVVVDPCAIGETYLHPSICGAHVLWQCLDAYATRYAPDRASSVELLRAFAGIGTISDIMPMLYENRKLVRDALSICRNVWECDDATLAVLKSSSQELRQSFRGLYATLRAFSAAGKIGAPSDMNEDSFGFYVAPAFNAAKRMDADMSRAFGVFTDANPTDDVRYLMGVNDARKSEVSRFSSELDSGDNPLAPICYVTDARHGILGLLATRETSIKHVPCVVLNRTQDGGYAGSGRSPEWFDFKSEASMLDGVSCHGHEQAFGIHVADDDALSRLYDFVMTRSDEIPDDVKSTGDADVLLSDDGSTGLVADSDQLLEYSYDVNELRPFGNGFPEPIVSMTFDAGNADWNVIGAGRNHLKVRAGGITMLCWNQADKVANGIPSGRVSVAGKVQRNEFRGSVSPQIVGDVSF